MNAQLIIGILAIYISLLFACAFFGERYANRLSNKARTILFSLTLAVYCSSWTFYGATGVAVNQGILFLPIFFGPILFLWLGHDIWRRLGQIRQNHAISSIADFISARYGKSAGLAALVTILAVVSVIPYLALQVHAISLSSSIIFEQSTTDASTHYGVLFLTAVLAILAMIFGTRHIVNTEQHGGLMLAVAFESVVKLFALLAVALFVLVQTDNSLYLVKTDIQQLIVDLQHEGLPGSFWTQTILAALAMICLPRQFHVAVVELRGEEHIRGARLWFTAYLFIICAAIIPIASWALHTPYLPFADSAVLMLPMSYGNDWLTILAFLGGFSASTGMLLVSSVALSIMLSNDLIMPILWKLKIISPMDAHLSQKLKFIRRLSILTVIALGFGFFWLFEDIKQLSVFGLLAFSAVAQFAPALIGGLYWRGGSKQGVYAGLLAGFSLWAYTLLFPTILRILPREYQTWANSVLSEGLFSIYILQPEALFNFNTLHPLTHGMIWSLGANILCFYFISRRYRPRITEQIQAESFFFYQKDQDALVNLKDNIPVYENVAKIKLEDLIALCQKITGNEYTQYDFEQYARHNELKFSPQQNADDVWWRFSEQYLAAIIGAASARTLLTTALMDNGIAVGQIANVLDQASQWQRFNQNLILTMINHLTQGVSVIDENLRLVAWNEQYLKLFNYPKELVYVGRPIADLIRYNAERGECGPGEVGEHVRKRVQWMQKGSEHEFERHHADGRVIQMRGKPIEGGGFVMTFADITAFRQNEALLEARVDERTRQLQHALKEQQIAREQADLANHSKSRFIAAASHDLLQPMHAARLFSAALEHSNYSADDKKTLEQLDRALFGAESMLSALLDIARLEGGFLKQQRKSYCLQDLFDDLFLQFDTIAKQRGIELKVHPTKYWIDTDPQWIRRIVQNLLSNALRYTASGRVIVGVLNHSQYRNHLRLGVWDTGLGIDEEQQKKLFHEFERGGHVSPWGEQGLGLGLSIVERMCRQLGYPIRVYSQRGKGSCFMIDIPKVPTPKKAQAISVNQIMRQSSKQVLQILCLDNDVAILDAMQVLLEKWGYQCHLAQEPEQAKQMLQQHRIDVALVDQHLNQAQYGLDFILQAREQALNLPKAVALLTADTDPDLPEKLKAVDITLLAKPIKPASLRAFLGSIKK
ncbi:MULTISPECIES: PAS-domain containing protein [unclassified Acinetobacter]|uniref:hybrid sensor histidine kinase/response regulator n=1 Tax=unclassified Acinetobacter TaxID=196816 RepID=UPI0035B8FF26